MIKELKDNVIRPKSSSINGYNYAVPPQPVYPILGPHLLSRVDPNEHRENLLRKKSALADTPFELTPYQKREIETLSKEAVDIERNIRDIEKIPPLLPFEEILLSDQDRDYRAKLPIKLAELKTRLRDIQPKISTSFWQSNFDRNKEAEIANLNAQISRVDSFISYMSRHPIIDSRLVDTMIDESCESVQIDYYVQATGTVTFNIPVPKIGIFDMGSTYFGLCVETFLLEGIFDCMKTNPDLKIYSRYKHCIGLVGLDKNYRTWPIDPPSIFGRETGSKSIEGKVRATKNRLNNILIRTPFGRETDSELIAGEIRATKNRLNNILIYTPFPGFVPPRVKKIIENQRNNFDNFIFIAEVPHDSWSWRFEDDGPRINCGGKEDKSRKLDPLLVGIKYETMWLLADFDTSAAEENIINNSIF